MSQHTADAPCYRLRSCRSRSACCVALLLTIAQVSVGLAAEESVDFGRDVLPILSDNCFLCHGPDAKTRKADLRLDRKEDALRTEGPVIVPGRSAESEVFLRVVSTDSGERMPPPKSGRTLSTRQVETLRRWIDAGAPWGQHWAFEAPKRPAIPTVRDRSWPINPVDRFVLSRLESEGLRPSPDAERTTLVRRVTLDLTGLPPTLAETDAFLADRGPDAYDRLVDRLLASPRYGERMVWEWLDAARYADSNGYQGDGERTMWPWRDWAVAALNRNMPFDEFTVWQLAGDLLPGASAEQKLATGFCRNYMINGEGGRIAEENRVDYVMDMAETTGTVWLALTFNCCRCHDHKFDPLAQRDYYSLFAFFNQTPVDGGGGNPQTPPVVEWTTPEQSAQRARLSAAVTGAAKAVDEKEHALFPRADGKPIAESPAAAGLPDEIVTALRAGPAGRSAAQLGALEKHWQAGDAAYGGLLRSLREAVDARNALNRSLPRVMVMADMPQPRATFILDRGSYQKPTTRVEADVPAALPRLAAGAPRNRLGLARWLVAPENPLTARVTVNRVWQQFFGLGLVKTPEDFGVQGESPSHPELLDWLATALVRSGWDVKALHRLIVTSATYRQSSRTAASLVERDPQNRLLARGARFRLPSWMIRDQALAASGLLSSRVGGAPVNPYQPSGVWEEATFGNKHYQQGRGEDLYRRSVYTFWRRIVGPTEFFDSAPRQTCVVKPTRTNSPLHALTTLNDPTFVEAARVLAERVLKAAPANDADRVDLAYRLVLARGPSPEERRVLLGSVARVRREFGSDSDAARKLLSVGESPRDAALDPAEHATFAAVCCALFNLDEACTKE